MAGIYKPTPRICIYCNEPFYAKKHAAKRRHCYKNRCIDRHARESPDRARYYQAYHRDVKKQRKYYKRYSDNTHKPEPYVKIERPPRRCRKCGCLHCGPFDMCAKCQKDVRDDINMDCMFIV